MRRKRLSEKEKKKSFALFARARTLPDFGQNQPLSTVLSLLHHEVLIHPLFN